MVKKERLVVAILVMVMLLSLGTATAQAAKYIVYDPYVYAGVGGFSQSIVTVSSGETIYVMNAYPNDMELGWIGVGTGPTGHTPFGHCATIIPAGHGMIYSSAMSYHVVVFVP